MPCPSLNNTREWTVARLTSELAVHDERILSSHLEECPECRSQADALREAWCALGTAETLVPSPGWAEETRRMMETKTLERRVTPFRRQNLVLRGLAQAAGLVLAAGAGYFLARRVPAEAPRLSAGIRTIPVVSEKTIDVSQAIPDLSNRPRMTNVSFQPADATGRVSISFDVTSRYTVVGKPEDHGVSSVVSYLLSGTTLTDGSRGKAIELVAEKAERNAALPGEVITTLIQTLKSDRNPSVRRRAAEALAKLPPSPPVRDAFLAALKGDSNPAVRMTVIEGLSQAGQKLDDAATIQILREKAVDGNETGYVRVKAASLLAGAEL